MLYQSLPTPHNRAYRPWPRVQPRQPSAGTAPLEDRTPYAPEHFFRQPIARIRRRRLIGARKAFLRSAKSVMRLLAYVRRVCLQRPRPNLVRYNMDAPKRSHLADHLIFPWRLAPASAPRRGSQTLAAEHQRRNLAVAMPPSLAGNHRSLSHT